MKKILFGALCAAATLAAVTSADAAGGCGWGAHRGPYGGCRANGGYYGGPAVVGVRVGGPVVGIRIGGFYPGRGYWDGRRYWARRYAWNGGWRYR